MKSFMYLIVFLLVGGFICAKTRPEKSDHINTLTETLIDEVKSGNIVSGVTESQISAVASKSNLVREFVGKMLHIDNYVVFTIGKVKWMGAEYVVSLGILGKVFTFTDARVAKEYIDSIKDKI
ncbi:MAG: hypothetical protein IIW75_03215 [Bacteroidaceae bacterium]|jgi:hypothetical protein|nr:hypothetical protein [Bacteroidaceae bacterium]